MNAKAIIAPAVREVLIEHESKYPWRVCACGWKQGWAATAPRILKRNYQQHLSEQIAERIFVKAGME